VLLEMAFILEPDIKEAIPGEVLEFFYMPPFLPHLHWRSLAGAFCVEIPTHERAVGTGECRALPHSASQDGG
jgi:hypothetical protein